MECENERIFEGVHLDPGEIIDATVNNIKEFIAALKVESVLKLPLSAGPVKWSKPTQGFLKVNYI